MLRYTTDRARPGLVALYDIWPGNGAGLFLHNPGARMGPSYTRAVLHIYGGYILGQQFRTSRIHFLCRYGPTSRHHVQITVITVTSCVICGPSQALRVSLHFNGHFPGEPGLASVY